MIKEQQTLSINMFINLLLVVIKITIGIVFNSYILITCGYYTLVNYIEEITSYIGSIIGMRKANMKYPFGYGRFNNILHIIVGIIFMLVGVYIFENTFYLEFINVNYNIIFILIGIILMHFLIANYLFDISKNIFSQALYVISKNNYYEAFINIFMSILIIISIWVPIVNLYGCLFIAILIFIKGLIIIINNFNIMHSQNDTSKKINDKIKRIINKYDKIKFNTIYINNIKNYFTITIEIIIDNDLTLPELLKIEKKVKYNIYKEKLNIRYIDFEIVNN